MYITKKQSWHVLARREYIKHGVPETTTRPPGTPNPKPPHPPPPPPHPPRLELECRNQTNIILMDIYFFLYCSLCFCDPITSRESVIEDITPVSKFKYQICISSHDDLIAIIPLGREGYTHQIIRCWLGPKNCIWQFSVMYISPFYSLCPNHSNGL